MDAEDNIDVNRIKKEVELLRDSKHPNVISYFGFEEIISEFSSKFQSLKNKSGDHSHIMYIIMELADQTLAEYILKYSDNTLRPETTR